jgi:hypothetical protein
MRHQTSFRNLSGGVNSLSLFHAPAAIFTGYHAHVARSTRATAEQIVCGVRRPLARRRFVPNCFEIRGVVGSVEAGTSAK